MLNISGIHEGYVLDHIKAGTSLDVFHNLGLDDKNYTVAVIMNVKSNKMGRKDIIKIEGDLAINFDVLGFIDNNITVCTIKNGELVKKENIVLPRRIKNVVKCKNPRCITSTEENLDQIFVLCDEKAHRYRCLYCEQAYKSHE